MNKSTYSHRENLANEQIEPIPKQFLHLQGGNSLKLNKQIEPLSGKQLGALDCRFMGRKIVHGSYL